MAVFIKRPRNPEPLILEEGRGGEFSVTGTQLSVLNAEGARIAKYDARSVKNYWIADESL